MREREPDTGIPTILRGVIDLVRRTGDVWQILGYRTDQIGATADADDELQARHRAQIRANPDLALGSPTYGWLDFAMRATAFLSNPERLRGVTVPVDIVSAGEDRLVDNAA